MSASDLISWDTAFFAPIIGEEDGTKVAPEDPAAEKAPVAWGILELRIPQNVCREIPGKRLSCTTALATGRDLRTTWLWS